GFANVSSVGIQIGGIGALAPDRKHDLARLGFRAMIAGTLANFLSATLAGMLLWAGNGKGETLKDCLTVAGTGRSRRRSMLSQGGSARSSRGAPSFWGRVWARG